MKPSAIAIVLASGTLFGFGLALSTMVQPEVVIDFLLWRDMGLLLVLGGAEAVTFFAYRYTPRILARPWAEAISIRNGSVPWKRQHWPPERGPASSD